jgi:hypothetical protein
MGQSHEPALTIFDFGFRIYDFRHQASDLRLLILKFEIFDLKSRFGTALGSYEPLSFVNRIS